MPIFAPLAFDDVRRMCRDAQGFTPAQINTCELAIDYLESRQLDRVRSELHARMPASQSGHPAQAVQPVALPLTDRFVSEAARLYSLPVTRELKTKQGETNDTTRRHTEDLKRFLSACFFDEAMHRNEQIQVLLKTSGLHFETVAGKLSPTLRLPHTVWHVRTKSAALSVSDPDAYDAFVFLVERGGVGKLDENTYAFVTNAETQFWRGADPTRLSTHISTYENPFKWEQLAASTEESKISFSRKELPGRMFTVWNYRRPIGALMPYSDPDIAAVNQELNVAWSVLMDLIRMQGHSAPVLTETTMRGDGQAVRNWGPRFPLVLKAGETFEMVSAATNYSDQVAALESFVKMTATFSRQSPNDYAMSASAPASGFAKLVDSLPKIEALQERARRAKAMEEVEVWPRVRAIGQYLGALDVATNELDLHVKFSKDIIPLDEQERSMRDEFELKHNLTTPAKLYAQRYDVSLEEAEKVIEENTKKNSTSTSQQPTMRVEAPAPVLGSRIARTRRESNGGQGREN